VGSEMCIRDRKINNDTHQLTLLLDSENSLQLLADMAHELMDSPVIIVDSSYKILAMNQEVIQERPDLEEQRQLGYLLDSNLESLRREGVYEKTRSLRYPYYSVDPDTGYGWITALVYVNGVEAAQIGVMELTHDFTRYEYELSHFLSKLVALELQKDDFYKHNHSLMHSVFLLDLLQERIRDSRTANTRCMQLGWVISDHMQLLAIFDKSMSAFDRKAQLIGEQVHNLIRGSRWVFYENGIVFLLPLSSDQQERLAHEATIMEYLTANHLNGSLSETFDNILAMKKHYLQCQAAFELGNRLQPKAVLYRYSDYILYHIGSIISNQKGLQDLFHPGIVSISRYDKEHDTDLSKTIELYLQYIDDPTTVSTRLNIHKNTLFYRINKIKETFNLDLNDGIERAWILLTLAFMKLE
jgi:sugar diacid utilization regulator